jgi:hypothetical protein
MQTRYESAGPDTTVMHWVQFKGTPKEVTGHDVFVVRGGKVVFQSVTVDPAKKIITFATPRRRLCQACPPRQRLEGGAAG